MNSSREQEPQTDAQAHRIRLMEEGDLKVAKAVFARAFFYDPISHYLFPDETDRSRCLEAVFEPYLRYGVRFGEVHTPAGPLEAGAMWLGPEDWHMTEERSSLVGFDDLPQQLGREAMTRFDSYFGWMNEVHEREAPARHFYLAVLAVDTARQGQGIGSSLIRAVTRQADEDGIPCYLETQQPRNVPLYIRHGFEVVVDERDPAGGVRTWAFIRQPQ